MALNLFDTPDYYTGLLGEEATQKLQNKALSTGLVNAALAFIAQPRNQAYGSALPYLGKALMGGYQAGQDVIQGGLRDYETQQKIAEMKRKQEELKAREIAISQLPAEQQALYRAYGEAAVPKLIDRALPAIQQPEYKVVGNKLLKIDSQGAQELYAGEKELKAAPTREVQIGRVKVQQELQPDGTWKEIGRGSMDAPQQPKEVGYTIQTDANGNAVYVPNRPGLPALDMQGKPTTYKPAPTAAEAKVQEKQAQAQKLPQLLNEAEKYIKGATGSYLGAGADIAAQTFGISTEGAQNIARLKGIEANLVLSMPRLEGPQSNLDQQLYRQAAGQIGDPTVPAETKLAALETIKKINTKYGAESTPSQQPKQAVAMPKVGEERNGYVFKGGNPNDQKSWIKKGK